MHRLVDGPPICSPDLACCGSELSADELVGMIPHGGLAGAVEIFGKDWDAARTTLIERLEGLQAAADAVAEAFTDVDGELASSVTGEK